MDSISSWKGSVLAIALFLAIMPQMDPSKPITLTDLRLKTGEKGFIAGQNGTGKSYLARQLIPPTGKLAIIDPKGSFPFEKIKGEEIKLYTNVRAIKMQRPRRFIYRPVRKSIRDYNAYNEVCLWAYNHAPCYLYIDEIVLLMHRRIEPMDLQTCYQLGREKGVTLLAVSQRPCLIPGYMVSESQRFYIFSLVKKADRDTIKDTIGEYPLPRTRHDFVFKDVHSDIPPRRMKLPGGL